MKWELKKSLTVGTAVMLLLMLCINIGFFVTDQLRERGKRYEDYDAFLVTMDFVRESKENELFYAAAYQDSMDEMRAISDEVYAKQDVMEFEEWGALFIEKVIEAPVPWEYPQLHRNYVIADKIAYRDIYRNYILTVPERANQATLLAGRDEQAYTKQNVQKTQEAFNGLEKLQLKISQDEGVEAAFNYALTDILVCVCLFLFCIRAFCMESDKGLFKLLSSMPKRLQIARGKLAALAVLSVCTAVLFFGANLLSAHLTWGLGDLSRPVQSIMSFRSCALRITVGQYLGYSLLFKCACALVCGYALLLLLIWLRKPALCLGAVGLIVGGQALVYRAIPVTSMHNAWRFINVLALRDSFTLFSRYQNINLFGVPRGVLSTSGAVLLALCALLVAVICVLFGKGLVARDMQTAKWIGRIEDAVQRFVDLMGSHTSVFIHEGFKLLYTQKAALMLIALIVLLTAQVNQYDRAVTPEQEAYDIYLSRFAGEITEDTTNEVQAEIQKLSLLTGDAARMAEASMEALARIESQIVMQQMQFEETGIPAYLVNDAGFKVLYSPKEDGFNVVLISLMMALLLSSLFAQDAKIHVLLRTCPGGIRKLIRDKLIWAMLLSVIVGALVYSAQFYKVSTQYPMAQWDAPVRSLECVMYNLDWAGAETSIGTYGWMLFGLRAIGLLLIGLAAASVSSLCQSGAIALLFNALLLVVPPLSSMLNLESMRILSQQPLLSGNLALQVYHGWSVLPMLLYIALIVFTQLRNYRRDILLPLK